VLRTWLGLWLVVGILSWAPTAAAQESVSPEALTLTAGATVDESSLERIRAALARSSPFRTAAVPRFYAQVTVRPPHFSEFMTNWDVSLTSIDPPSVTGGVPAMGGVDLLSLLGRLVQAHRNRELRQLRERIDRELEALKAGME
jgi:hypothetical protein